MNSVAWRLPSVIVPVLSSSSVWTSPAASTARPDIASTLRCTMRSMPAMPIADSSAPIVVGMRHTSRATSTTIVLLGFGVDGERLQRDDGEQEDDREPGEQDVERDLVRRLLPLGAFDERDHPVEERLARLGRDAHDDLVGEHPGAAGDRRAVAAGLADDRRRLAGDRRLVDGRDALDDVAVARDHLAGGDDALVADLQLAARDLLDRAVGAAPARHRLRAGLAQRRRLRLAAPLGHRLGEVREQHREPQERGDRGRRTRSRRPSSRRGRGRTGSSSARCRRARRTSPGCGPARAGCSLRTLSTSAPRTIAGSNSDRVGSGCRSRALLPTGTDDGAHCSSPTATVARRWGRAPGRGRT